MTAFIVAVGVMLVFVTLALVTYEHLTLRFGSVKEALAALRAKVAELLDKGNAK